MLFSDPIVIGKLRAEHVVDFRIPLEPIMHFEPEMFKDIKLIDDELTKINETWCEVVHAANLHPRHATKTQATKKLSSVMLTYITIRIGNMLIWLKDWNYSDKRELRYLIYIRNLK